MPNLRDKGEHFLIFALKGHKNLILKTKKSSKCVLGLNLSLSTLCFLVSQSIIQNTAQKNHCQELIIICQKISFAPKKYIKVPLTSFYRLLPPVVEALVLV